VRAVLPHTALQSVVSSSGLARYTMMQDGEHHMCRGEALATCLLDAVSSAANMRSFPSEASTHVQPRVRVSAPCLTLPGTFGATVCSRCGSYASTFLPPVPRRSFAFCASRGFRRFGTMKALTPVRLTYRAGLPAYLATPSCRSVSNHVGCLSIAYHHASVLSEFRTSP
jgi:hypothetical protein